MAITKTKFIEYTRCPRYVALNDLKKSRLSSMLSFAEYKEEEQEALKQELLSDMFDDNDNDLIEKEDAQLKAMMPYYSMVEILAGQTCKKYFKGTFKYSAETNMQESFDCKINGTRYLCYVDIFNEVEDHFNIIEVKATTSRKYAKMTFKVDKVEYPMFVKDENGIYKLKEEVEGPIDDEKVLKGYLRKKEKLYDRFSDQGRYVYDLAVQRYIVENDLKENNQGKTIDKVKYYLAVLNADYVFDGKYVDGKPVYDTVDMEEIVSFIDMTSITKDMQDIVDNDRKRLEKYIQNLDGPPCNLGKYCENKKTTVCKYKDICWKDIPNKHSVVNLFGISNGFKVNGDKVTMFDLINDGIVKITDIPKDYVSKRKQEIQINAIEKDEIYIDKEKIKKGLNEIKYPVYHLDFETFPCPLPRFKGERCYSQSVFQFSIHIEKEPGVLDKEQDHYHFLASDHSDRREELVDKMLSYIDVNSGGTILSYNESFEKTRIKELAELFPKYALSLKKLNEMMFDLMYIVNTKSSLYKDLGIDEERAKLMNYYHKDFNGSFSIKKVLPVFSNLSYEDMEIANGMDALITYANYPNMSEDEFNYKYNKLVEYCKQDTYAMYEILNEIRKL